MAEANQATQGLPATGDGTTQATAIIDAAESLYGKDPVKEPAIEGEQSGERKDWLDEGAPAVEPYNIRLPEGTFVDKPVLAEFTKWARENKLSDAQVQAAADFHLKSLGDATREAAEYRGMGEKRYQEVEGWRAELDRDPYFGGAKVKESVAAANRALSVFGTPEEVGRLKKEFERTGLGNHPVLIRGLARVAKLLGTKASSNEGKSAAAILYPNNQD